MELDLRDWLSEWWKPLPKGGWHAPIVLVNGKIISQGRALNRGVLTQAVIEAATTDRPLPGNHIFGKSTCPHCVRAKGYLAQAHVPNQYYDVVKDTRALYEMLARVKPIIGPKTPVTVPQICDRRKSYIGGGGFTQGDPGAVRSRTEPRPRPMFAIARQGSGPSTDDRRIGACAAVNGEPLTTGASRFSGFNGTKRRGRGRSPIGDIGSS